MLHGWRWLVVVGWIGVSLTGRLAPSIQAAQQRTWIGPENGDWFEATNWDPIDLFLPHYR